MALRGVRGAITVERDGPEEILSATRELLDALVQANQDLQTTDIASAIFTVTDDLQATYPALAARELGWQLVPMMCGREIPVPGSVPRCIRILVHWNTELPQSAIRHIYLREAVQLRPDLAIINLE